MKPTDPAFPLAFPRTEWKLEHGLTSRAYAAIHLRVPDSGEEWLDKMIVDSLRNDFSKMPPLGSIPTSSEVEQRGKK